MTLFSPHLERSRSHDQVMGGTTAVVAGLVNVCSVMAFFAFASNVTGHVAVFAEELIRGHVHQVFVLILWLSLFASGAGISGYVIHRARSVPLFARWSLAPLYLELLLLFFVGFYGSVLYDETLRETEMLVGVLLLAMGLQNGMVASVSKGVVKTTHLTGLLTDLGMELAQFIDPSQRGDETLRFKLALHLLTLGGYLVGGVAGGFLFQYLDFGVFYVGSILLLAVILQDMSARWTLADASP